MFSDSYKMRDYMLSDGEHDNSSHCEHVGMLIWAFSSHHSCAQVKPNRVTGMAVES